MSFSSKAKDELLNLVPEKDHCLTAELAALYTAEDPAQGSAAAERKAFLLARAGAVPDRSEILDYAGRVRASLIRRACCKRAFLRGIFFLEGSVSNPEKNYHLEIVCSKKARHEQIVSVMKALLLKPKTVERKGHYVIYLKEGDQIADLLGLIGANVSLLVWENVRVTKDVRNAVNRKVNCETANLSKTVSAALEQVRMIERIEARDGLDSLPWNLREIAVLRLESPDSSLSVLGEMLFPPVGKSGVNHRMRKLKSIAEEERL